MRYRAVSLALAAAAVLGSTTVAEAQRHVRFGLAGTGIFSLEDGGGSRFGGMALVQAGPSHGLGFRADLTVTHGDDFTSEIATVDAVYTFHTPESLFHPYLLGGLGLYHQSDLTKPLAKAGLGLEYHIKQRNRGTVLFGELTGNFLFAGEGYGGTSKSLQANIGLKFGGE
jgi:hypothetical protein